MPSRTMTESKTDKSKRGSSFRRWKGSFGKGSTKKDDKQEESDQAIIIPAGPTSDAPSAEETSQVSRDSRADRADTDRRRSRSDIGTNRAASDRNGGTERKKKKGIVGRMRSLSRSRSRSRSAVRRQKDSGDGSDSQADIIVTVTSCRCDGYHNQKAPGSTSKLPRKAPSNLKLFHELAVGLKDAYAAEGKTPTKPKEEGEEDAEQLTDAEYEARMVLWEFIGNIDFLLALVDEVAVDTATRGALKDDTTFKGLRDVIKKCNKVLENMLVRRERRYTLFFRLPSPTNPKDIERIKSWNDKVEKAVGAVTEGGYDGGEASDGTMDSDSDVSSVGTSDASNSSSVFRRGRQLLPVAGRVRSRRATPTPTLRQHRSGKEKDDGKGEVAGAAEDGFATQTIPATNLSAQKNQMENKGSIPNGLVSNASSSPKQQLQQSQTVQPKDELVDVIRGLRLEKMKNRESTQESDLTALKPDWRPKADIPSAVPKLPTEYIHRHRLMKQVVSCLLDETVREADDGGQNNTVVTSITSRHGDKAGNGKTILAVASIQTVEVRERFCDGIGWVKLGRGPLSERDVRRLYEELYRQLILKDSDLDEILEDINGDMMADSGHGAPSRGSNFRANEDQQNGSKTESRKQRIAQLAGSRRRFQGGDIEGIKEDLGRLLIKRKVLICLDDVCRVEDAKWFIFDNKILNGIRPHRNKKGEDSHPLRVLITTRTPNMLGPGLVQEVFVRILSEHEAVKLLLSTSGRRPYGGKNSTVFNQAKLIVKGCGNSPLAVRLSGSMLRQSNRSWNISSPAWSSLIHQCRLNLEEASQLRSFVNAVNRVVDLSFFTVGDVRTRVALRRCFVAFAMAFRDNDWILSGKGIPQSVVLRVFRTIIASDDGFQDLSGSQILSLLEKLNLIERARHGCLSRGPLRLPHTPSGSGEQREESERSDSDWDDDIEPRRYSGVQQMFVMHDSLKAVAEEMGGRNTATLSPDADDFTSYLEKIEEERKFSQESNSLWVAPFRFLAQQFTTSAPRAGFQGDEAHKLVVSSLLNIGDDLERNGSVAEALKNGQLDVLALPGGGKMEEYLTAFLPSHLMKCQAFTVSGEVLADAHFIGRRVQALGIVEATGRHVADLQELRRLGGNITIMLPSKNDDAPPASPAESATALSDPDQPATPTTAKFDVNGIVRDGSKILIDEVYRVANMKSDGNSSDSLGMAMCLAAVGDGLLKARQPKDAMLRLEEAVGIYKGVLGSYHTNVADALHSVAKALVKLGETRVALLKFAEAARIYEACNATLHFNSIANAQSLASLLVDLGDMEKAQSMFEEVISMRRTVYGSHCVPVAKTINSYAILLAKHGRMNEALEHYEAAKSTYGAVPAQLIRDPEFEIKCKYDVTLINLNIASIRSKKGDLTAAIECYEDGVSGLREYESALAELHKDSTKPVEGKNTAHKHLIAALGRIGSLKLKIGDNDGALVAYMTLLQEVKDDSPAASHTEKAKAHIKCATIFRQQDGDKSHDQSISHLREALDMYTAIFGPEHKDTLAIASSLRQWLSEDQKL